MLSNDEYKEILNALCAWAETAPDEPVMGFIGGDFLTPRQIAWAVKQRTKDGEALVEILEHGVRREGVDQVIGRLGNSQVTG